MLSDLNLLQTLLAVVDGGSHAAAAERLHVTASAVSQQIKLLERRLEVPVFERVGRRSVLTADGERLVERVRPLLADIGVAVERHQERHRALAGTVRIGSATGFFAAWLRPRLVPFLHEHPRVRLAARFTLLSRLPIDLAAGELDLGISVGLPDHPQLEAAPLYRQEFIAVGSAARLADKTEFTAAELRAESFVVFDHDEFMHRNWWRRVFGAKEPLPDRIAHEIGNIFELRAFMEEGFGIAILPRFFVQEAIDAGRVRRLTPLNEKRRPIRQQSQSTVHLLWRKREVEPQRVQTVRDLLLQSAQQPAVEPRY
ncbi:MAG: LysR family transcriptional regulator [Myxococcota bacterium]